MVMTKREHSIGLILPAARVSKSGPQQKIGAGDF